MIWICVVFFKVDIFEVKVVSVVEEVNLFDFEEIFVYDFNLLDVCDWLLRFYLWMLSVIFMVS